MLPLILQVAVFREAFMSGAILAGGSCATWQAQVGAHTRGLYLAPMIGQPTIRVSETPNIVQWTPFRAKLTGSWRESKRGIIAAFQCLHFDS